MSDETTKRTKHQAFEAVEMHRRELRGASYNPRNISPANKSRLKKGIKKHGLVDAIIVNKRTGNLVGGHQRLASIDELEGTDDYTMTVQLIDVDENDEMALNMLLNNPSAQGHFESDLQRELFEHLVEQGYDLANAGYTTTDVQTMYPDIFATGQLAEQLEAEADIVNTIHEMSQTGKEYESEFREAMGLNQRSEVDLAAAPQASTSTGVQYEDVDDEHEEPSSTDVPSAEDGTKWYADKDYFKNERQRTVQQNAEVKAEADVMLTFAFQTKAQMLGFMKAFGLPEEKDGRAKRYFDVHDVMSSFGIEL